MDPPDAVLTDLLIAAEPSAWSAAGFEVESDLMRLGSVLLRFRPPGGGGTNTGLAGWRVDGADPDGFDGLPPVAAAEQSNPDSLPAHPNSATSIDHVVVFTPELERTIAAFEANGVRCRRIREVGPADAQLRQAFFRLGEVIAEVVQVPLEQAGPGGAATFWGITIVVEDLDAAVAGLGNRVGTIRDAVQTGRRIATLRREAGLGLPVALISPSPPKGSGTEDG